MKHLLAIAMLAVAVNVRGETTTNQVYAVSATDELGRTNVNIIIGSSPPPVAVTGDLMMSTNLCTITMTDKGIRKLAADGRICEALGRHFWRPGRPGEGEGSIGGNAWYADYHPGTTYRTCAICGKCESKTEGAWK